MKRKLVCLALTLVAVFSLGATAYAKPLDGWDFEPWSATLPFSLIIDMDIDLEQQ